MLQSTTWMHPSVLSVRHRVEEAGIQSCNAGYFQERGLPRVTNQQRPTTNIQVSTNDTPHQTLPPRPTHALSDHQFYTSSFPAAHLETFPQLKLSLSQRPFSRKITASRQSPSLIQPSPPFPLGLQNNQFMSPYRRTSKTISATRLLVAETVPLGTMSWHSPMHDPPRLTSPPHPRSFATTIHQPPPTVPEVQNMRERL